MGQKLTYQSQKNFFDLFEGKTTIKAFETWLYNSNNLENTLKSVYFDLIILDFSNYNIIKEIEDITQTILDYPEHEKQLLLQLMNHILNIDETLPQYLKLVYENSHHPLLKKLEANTYGLTFEYGPNMEDGIYYDKKWSSYSSEKRKEIVEPYFKDIQKEISNIILKASNYNFSGDLARDKTLVL